MFRDLTSPSFLCSFSPARHLVGAVLLLHAPIPAVVVVFGSLGFLNGANNFCTQNTCQDPGVECLASRLARRLEGVPIPLLDPQMGVRFKSEAWRAYVSDFPAPFEGALVFLVHPAPFTAPSALSDSSISPISTRYEDGDANRRVVSRHDHDLHNLQGWREITIICCTQTEWTHSDNDTTSLKGGVEGPCLGAVFQRSHVKSRYIM
ncbi:hypothetical protein D9757_010273 [Collybiopsis confluens]|uniref:Uncharacterized protein n=1 Tax=Collybiopsis confluens TaxID=2823264 RepID=A0A8H5HB21_9AGAR|nr:hypothetical protein D9757_010273 [Collybiopsis confluens]